MESNSWIPFVLGTGASQPKFSFQRIFEAVLIGIMVAGITTYITQQVIKVELLTIKTNIARIERNVDQIRTDFYKPYVGMHNESVK